MILASILWRSISSAARRSLYRRWADAMAAAWMVPQTSCNTASMSNVGMISTAADGQAMQPMMPRM